MLSKIQKCNRCKKLFFSEKGAQGIGYPTRCLECSEKDRCEIRRKIFNDNVNLINLKVK